MWNKLNFKDRAKLISLGVERGINDLDEIKDAYNRFADGGMVNRDTQSTNSFEQYFRPEGSMNWADYFNDPTEAKVDKYVKSKVPLQKAKQTKKKKVRSFDQLSEEEQDAYMQAHETLLPEIVVTPHSREMAKLPMITRLLVRETVNSLKKGNLINGKDIEDYFISPEELEWRKYFTTDLYNHLFINDDYSAPSKKQTDNRVLNKEPKKSPSYVTLSSTSTAPSLRAPYSSLYKTQSNNSYSDRQYSDLTNNIIYNPILLALRRTAAISPEDYIYSQGIPPYLSSYIPSEVNYLDRDRTSPFMRDYINNYNYAAFLRELLAINQLLLSIYNINNYE